MTPKKLVLIDGNALVHRAFHALPPTLTSPKGLLTNAIYGFTAVLFKMIKDIKPDYIAATFDLAGPTFRHEEFAEYKIHREKAPDELYKQIPPIKEMLGLFGIPIYEKEGYEADDAIGTLSEEGSKQKDLQVIIVTGDLDTLQLVKGDKVVVFTMKKGINDTVTYNEDEVRKRYGISPLQVVDYKGLKGDPSDNIPGVPGIGDKTASILIQKYGSIENLYKKLEENKKTDLSPKLIEKLLANKDQAFFSKKLATIIKDLDIDFKLEKSDWKNNLDKEKIEKFFKEMGFFSLIKRLPEITGQYGSEIPPENTAIQGGLDLGAVQEPAKLSTRYVEIKDKDDIQELRNRALISKKVAIGLENESLYLCPDDKNTYRLSLDKIRDFSDIIEDKKILKIGYDLKPILKLILENKLEPDGIEFDIRVASYILNSDIKDYSLEKLYYLEFEKNPPIDPREKFISTWELYKKLKEQLASKDLLRVFEDIEMPLVKVLARTELSGIKINKNSLDKLSEKVNKELRSLEKKIYSLAEGDFNINSPQQLSEVLFERLKLTGKIRKTGKGALSTAASELEKLSEAHPIIELILKYRELQKLKTTYIEPFPELINKKTGRLYTTLNQTGATTGRLSSQDPNLQNIPIRTELGQEFRKAFISPSGYKLLSLDYSQLELRIAAHISGDKKMSEAFKRGEDIHTRTASEIFGVSQDKVTTAMRREAKTLNFGILYGMGQMGFQRAAKVSRAEAKDFIERYMREFSGIAAYMQRTREEVRKRGYVETIFGRRRYLPEINSGIHELVRQAERMAINMPVQGTEADLLKLAMIKIDSLINSDYKSGDVRMLLQIHDELLFEVKNDLLNDAGKKIKYIMENIYHLDVPLTVDAKYGDNWSAMELL